jgi:superfamily II DNA or RNA helicase
MSEAVLERPTMPNGSLYYSPLGIFPFQADCVIELIKHDNRIGIVDTGLGKTHIAMCAAAMLYEDGLIDLVVHVGRAKKLAREEFPADWAKFTSLRTLTYHGALRHKRLQREGIPDVLLTTYETGAAELMTRKKTPGKIGKGGRVDGPLVGKLGLHDKRVLWIFDEVHRLGSRSAERYQSWYYILNQLRRGPHLQRALGLTATIMSTGDERAFNVARLICPDQMPTVTDYEKQFTRGRDQNYQYIYLHDQMPRFDRIFQSCIFRKSQEDPDVRDQMPKLIVDAKYVDLLPEHKALYETVSEIYGEGLTKLTNEQRTKRTGALKLIAGHPAAVLHSGTDLSQAIVDTLGEEFIRSIPSSKSRSLIEELEELVTGQGAQVIIFTWWANTVLPELAIDLRSAGFQVATFTGEQSDRANREAKEAFKSGTARILLSSDAGSEGLNLPEATYVIEYEPATAVDVRQQRFGRHQRLVGGKEPIVYGWSMVLRQTVEVDQFETVMTRAERQDSLYGDDKNPHTTKATDEKKRMRDRR